MNEPTNVREGGAGQLSDDRRIELQYAELVASLGAEQQAWERALQEGLGSTFGGFYLPIYMRERVAGVPSAWNFVADDPALPRVLLIGDSISRGYTLPVRRMLAGKANVHRAPENCGATSNGVNKIAAWLGNRKWDVIHFNFGLHDAITPADLYEKQLRLIVSQLLPTGATVIWATTTPRPADTADGPAVVEVDAVRREIALRVMREAGVTVNDLEAYVIARVAPFQKPRDVHFTDEGYEVLGEQVARAIESAIGQRRAL